MAGTLIPVSSSTSSLLADAPTYAAQAAASAAAAALSEAATAADVVTTNADVVLTNADVVLTHADVVLTNADVVSTAADAVATAADRVQTGLDAAAAALYKVEDAIHAATSKATPVDADEVGIVDSEASNVLKKLTFANLWTWISGRVSTLLAAGTEVINFKTVADIASASTIDLSALGSGFEVTVTGTTAITAITMVDGQFGTIIPSAALPFTYHAGTCRVSTLADFVSVASQPVKVHKKGSVIFVEPQIHAANSSVASSGVSTTSDFAVYTGAIEVKINGTAYNQCWSSRDSGGAVGNMQSTHSVLVTGSSCEIAAYLNGTTTALATTLTFPETGTYLVTATASCSTYSTSYANWVTGSAIRVR